MKLLCRLFGHNLKRYTAEGIKPSILKYVFREVYVCERGDFRSEKDEITRDYDVSEGRIAYGSGGPCYLCSKYYTCPETPKGPYVWVCCPVHSFEFGEGWEERVRKWDCLVS